MISILFDVTVFYKELAVLIPIQQQAENHGRGNPDWNLPVLKEDLVFFDWFLHFLSPLLDTLGKSLGHDSAIKLSKPFFRE